jgi:hypothetical protein
MQSDKPERPASSEKYQIIDDMRDGEDIQQWKYPLGLIIAYIHTSLYETYSEYDRDAIDKQKKHIWFSFFAVFFGSTAIILAILQVFLQAHAQSISLGIDPESIVIFERGAFLTAVIAVCIAAGSHWHRDWLKKRYMAEQCRSLKFRALIHPYLSFSPDDEWNDHFTYWKTKFDEKVSLIENNEGKSLENILVIDKVNNPPHETQVGSLNILYLEMLTDYYQKKRITTQIEYLTTRARTFGSMNKHTGRITEYCFIGGVVFAGVQFGIEGFHSQLLTLIPDTALWSFLRSVALLITLFLPSLGIAVRTFRSSIEVSRSASLFNAKCKALKEFDKRLTEERDKKEINWLEILKIMWESENFFENENREWLRIMHDAEWFL